LPTIYKTKNAEAETGNFKNLQLRGGEKCSRERRARKQKKRALVFTGTRFLFLEKPISG